MHPGRQAKKAAVAAGRGGPVLIQKFGDENFGEGRRDGRPPPHRRLPRRAKTFSPRAPSRPPSRRQLLSGWASDLIGLPFLNRA